jgi:hypothetical protein
MQILRCPENDSPPQREEGTGVVGGTVSERQPPLTPPYQGGESFSCEMVGRRIMESSFGMTAQKDVLQEPTGLNVRMLMAR